ncbi:MAG: HAMP domain-containing histidine kinase [Chitinophagaceae bacterium]|nr:HAMP domain-containing histidine kinase [Chitinophagaceae bacterium]
MTRLRWLAILMGAVILIIGGFQVYWLRDNYLRASRELETRTALLFRETYRELNDSLIRSKLNSAFFDSLSIGDLRGATNIRVKNATTRVIDQLRVSKLDTSLKRSGQVAITLKTIDDPGATVITRARPREIDSIRPSEIESINIFRKTKDADADSLSDRRPRHFTNSQIVIRLDSLINDTVQINVLTKRFEQVLAREHIEAPFEIVENNRKRDTVQFQVAGAPRRWMTVDREEEPYALRLGKVYPYLFKQLSLPILFSFFLVGITIFSFVLLYRSLRRQQRLAQMKTDLINNITHELKTPIATVGVAIEALKNFNAIQDPARTREYLDISQQELQRLGLLVDKVLKLSMFEKNELELQSQLFDLGDLVTEVVASLRLQLEKYQGRITLEKQGDLNMYGDRLHMQSVVFNLLDNALKYSKGNAAIQVQLKQTDDGIQMKITDNGIGIPEAYQHKVFEKFFRVPAGDTHNAKGHGLGLSYVAQVVQQHGGTIHLDSHVGLGSTFTINLPSRTKDKA